MKMRIDDIPESGKTLDFQWDEKHFHDFFSPDDPVELGLAHPLDVHLEIYRQSDHVRITGSVQGALRAACHRCLKPFEWTLDESVDAYLMQAPEGMTEDEEIEVDSEEEMDLEFFEGDVIDIDRFVLEQIFLAIPYKLLCSESCRGICPGCGADLNDEECKCKGGASASLFTVLKGLKGDLP